MNIQLSKAEIRLFALFIAKGELSLEEVATESGISHSRASRLVKSLVEKGFLNSRTKGWKKKVALSNSAHSLTLKELIESSPHITFDTILGNSAIGVFMGFSEKGSSADQIAQMAATPEITVKRTLAKLMMKGVVLQPKRGTYVLSLPGIWKFLDAYRLFLAEEFRKGISGSLIVSKNWGILRTSHINLPANFIKTGISLFSDFGVPLNLTDFHDYYYSILGKTKKPSREEILVHAILRSTLLNSSREISYVLLAMEKNLKKLNKGKFMEAAKRFGVESISEECWKYLENFNKPESITVTAKFPLHPLAFSKLQGPIFPSKEEFGDLVKQYG